MDVGFVLRTWFATLRHQRLLWVLGALLLVAYLPFILVSRSLDFLSQSLLEGALSETTLVTWAIGLVVSIILGALLLVGFNLVVNVGVILTTARAYPHPTKVSISWSDLRPHMARGFLRLLLLSLFGGGLALVIVLVFLLPLLGGVMGSSLFQEPQDLNALWLVLLSLGVTGFFILLCCLPIAIFFIGPFVASTTVAVVVEGEQAFLRSVQQGLLQARRKYGWWVLTILGGTTVAVVLNLVPAPFRALSGLLEELQNQGLPSPLFLNAIISGLAEVLNAIVGVLQTLALLTLYTVVYLHLREQLDDSPSSPVENPILAEPPGLIQGKENS